VTKFKSTCCLFFNHKHLAVFKLKWWYCNIFIFRICIY